MEKEIWKDIPNYEGYYQCSNFGRVKSIERIIDYKNTKRVVKSTILKFGKTRGYYNVNLCVNGDCVNKSIHQLVAITFLNHFANYYTLVVNHKDGNKLNNNLLNLEIITHRCNCIHGRMISKNKTSKYYGVTYREKRKSFQAVYRQKYIGTFKNEEDAFSAILKQEELYCKTNTLETKIDNRYYRRN